MEAVGLASSIITLVEVTRSVIDYLRDVKDAPKQCQQCEDEVLQLELLLIDLAFHLKHKFASYKCYKSVEALNEPDGALSQYKAALESLKSKIRPESKTQKIKMRLTWPFIKEEVADFLDKIQRLITLISTALQLDNFQLSLEILQNTRPIPGIQTNVLAIQDNQLQLLGAQEREERRKIMKWLSPANYELQLCDIISLKQKDTGQWFLDSEEFKRWVNGSIATLFCPGYPGTGKTMIAATAINYLQEMTKSGKTQVAYLFCNYKTRAEQSTLHLLSDVLKQLVQPWPKLPDSLTNEYTKHQSQRPAIQEIVGTLHEVCSKSKDVTTFVVVDALDEHVDANCPPHQLIGKLRELQSNANVRLMVTSRCDPEIEEQFSSTTSIQVSASEYDVRRFVAGQMHRLPKYKENLQLLIEDRIVKIANGVFLLCSLCVELLRDKRLKRQVESTLDQIPQGAKALTHAYDKVMDQIERQPPEDVSLAKRAICWVACAKRLLTPLELCGALSIQPRDTTHDLDDVYDIKGVITVTAGLLTVDKRENVVRLVHFTLQDHLDLSAWKQEVQQEMAMTSLTCLSLATSNEGCNCTSPPKWPPNLPKYVKVCWLYHLQQLRYPLPKSELTSGFLKHGTPIQNAIQKQVRQCLEIYSDACFCSSTSGLHIAAWCGLIQLFASQLLHRRNKPNPLDVNLENDFKHTPLMWAAANGQEAMVQWLLCSGKADVNRMDGMNQTSLYFAARMGHHASVRELLKSDGVRVNTVNYYNKTPLFVAAERGHAEVVQLLLSNTQTRVNSQDSEGQTPLSAAVRGNHERTVDLLLSTAQVRVNVKDNDGCTPLSVAAASGFERSVQRLLATNGVDVNSKDDSGRTPLMAAAHEGRATTVGMLLQSPNIRVNRRDKDDSTALILAVRKGSIAAVQHLIEAEGIEINATDKTRRTALTWATEHGKEEIAQLLRRPVGSRQMDIRGNGPLCTAPDEE